MSSEFSNTPNAVPPAEPADTFARPSSKIRLASLFKNNIFSSIAPCLSRFFRIKSKSEITSPAASNASAATIPLDSIAEKRPSDPIASPFAIP